MNGTERPRLWQRNDETKWRLFHRPGTGWYAYQPTQVHEPMFPAQDHFTQVYVGGQYGIVKPSFEEALPLFQLAMAKAKDAADHAALLKAAA